MTTFRKVALGGVAIALLLGALAAHAFINATPTNCTFPAQIDTFVTYQPGEIIPSATWNKMECILDKLMRRMKALPAQEKVCSVNTVVPASVRQIIELTAAAPFVGTELVLPQMPIDTIDPPGVALDGIDQPIGSSVAVWVFNRDADRDRTVKVCATVIRP